MTRRWSVRERQTWCSTDMLRVLERVVDLSRQVFHAQLSAATRRCWR